MYRQIATWLVIVPMFTLFSGQVDAQELTGGVKGGLNIADLHGTEVPPGDLKVGLAVGGFVTYSVNERFAIQPEVLVYTQKGMKTEVPGGESKLILDYLEIPVLAKVMIPVETSVSPSVFAGPALGVKLRAKEKTEVGGQEEEVDLDEGIKSTDFGLVIGGGIAFDVAASALTVDGRYTVGLTKFDDIEPVADMKNGVFSIMVGYVFSFE